MIFRKHLDNSSCAYSLSPVSDHLSLNIKFYNSLRVKYLIKCYGGFFYLIDILG